MTIDNKQHQVVKANNLIQAHYNLSLAAQRMLVLAIIEAREQHRLIDAMDVLRIPKSSYARHFDVETSTPYKILKDAIKTLVDSKFIWHDKDENGKTRTHESNFLQRGSYVEDSSYIEVIFTVDILPLITRLDSEFTKYDLLQIKDLQSGYSLRLFELLSSWRSIKQPKYVTVNELRTQLGVTADQYSLMSNFKMRVLDNAVKEITERTDLDVSYEQVKDGRKITGFNFKYSSKKSKKQTPKTFTDKQLNGDMFTIDGLSDAQLGRITRCPKFIQDFGGTISPNDAKNKDMALWSEHFINEIKLNPSTYNTKRPIRDYLDY